MDYDDLAKKIKKLRAERGLTQDELADKANLSLFTLAKLEQGKVKNPSFFTVLALSEALMTTPNFLAGIDSNLVKIAPESAQNAPKAVFLDVHGVLIEGWTNWFKLLGESLGMDPYKVEERFWHYDQLVITGKMTFYDFEQALADDLGVKQRQINYREFYLKACKLHQPAFDLISIFKKQQIKVGLFTNIFPGFLDELIKIGVLPCSRDDFDFIIESHQVGSQKPQIPIYEAAEQAAGLLPRKLLLVDDSPTNADTAQSRNWQTIVYSQDYAQSSVDAIKQLIGID